MVRSGSPLAHPHIAQQIAWRRNARPTLSVIVPCLNEEDVIERTHDRLVSCLVQQHVEFEIVYVDDGSRDSTLDILAKILESDSHVRVVRLSRNFGHQLAVTAGLEHAEGDVVAIIDADLQDPPEALAEMLDRWRDGYDVVYGRRIARAGESPPKLLTASWFYRVMNRIAVIKIPLDVGDFRLMDRAVVNVLCQMPEPDRFLRGMVSWVGFRQAEVLYKREARAAGDSKYPLRRMLRLAVDGIISFSDLPLRATMFLGAGVIALGMAMGLTLLLAALIGLLSVSGWSIVLVAMTLLGGLQLLAIGVVGEYVSRVYQQAKGRPLYVVAEQLGFRSKEQRRDVA